VNARAFGKRFGLSAAAIGALTRRLNADGIEVLTTYPQRTALSARAHVATVDRLFDVRIDTYRDRSGRRAHVVVGRPTVPGALARYVIGISGLDTRPRWRPGDVAAGGLTPLDAAIAYDVAPLHRLGILGQGLRIALISFSDFDHSEPGTFAARFGITGPTPRIIPIDGGTIDLSGATESNLDIDVIRAIAPAAQIDVYQVGQSSSGYTDAINQIVAAHSYQVVSSSWGQCELGIDPAERAGDSQALAAARAADISVFVASGDSGAYDCQEGNLLEHQLSVDWPASSANVIAVGGTRLSVRANGSYAGESAWEDPLSARGGGGGFTTGDARPAWQRGPGVLDRYSTGRRQLPDVSADADPGTGWSIYSNGAYTEAGGTSAATPFWAASTLLIEQYAAEHGVSRLGFVDPLLYALASSRQPFPPFHDVTVGANRYFAAAPGWDPATGLGSPDVYNLARDMVAYLRRHPR
jgi:kumamolisin